MTPQNQRTRHSSIFHQASDSSEEGEQDNWFDSAFEQRTGGRRLGDDPESSHSNRSERQNGLGNFFYRYIKLFANTIYYGFSIVDIKNRAQTLKLQVESDAEVEEWIQEADELKNFSDLASNDDKMINFYRKAFTSANYVSGFLWSIIRKSYSSINTRQSELLGGERPMDMRIVTTFIEIVYWQDSIIVGAFMWMAGAISWPIRIVVGSALQLLSDLYRLAQDIIYTLILLTLLIADIAHEAMNAVVEYFITAVGYCEAMCDGIEHAQSVLKNCIMRLTITFDTYVSRALGSRPMILCYDPINDSEGDQAWSSELDRDNIIRHQKFDEESLIDLNAPLSYIQGSKNSFPMGLARLSYQTTVVYTSNQKIGKPVLTHGFTNTKNVTHRSKVTHRSLV